MLGNVYRMLPGIKSMFKKLSLPERQADFGLKFALLPLEFVKNARNS